MDVKSQDESGQHSLEQALSIDPRTSDPDVVAHHDFDDSTSELTVTIVDAVASAVGVSPTEVVPRVDEHVDPDALDRLFRPRPDGTPREGRLVFELLDCRVAVDGDGAVLVYTSS